MLGPSSSEADSAYHGYFDDILTRQKVVSALNNPSYQHRKASAIHLFRVANCYYSTGDIGRGKAFLYGGFKYIRSENASQTISDEVANYQEEGGPVRPYKPTEPESESD